MVSGLSLGFKMSINPGAITKPVVVSYKYIIDNYVIDPKDDYNNIFALLGQLVVGDKVQLKYQNQNPEIICGGGVEQSMSG